MSIRVKVGLSKKVGQPDFGSLGASCEMELEVDGSLLSHDLQSLQQKIQDAYVACRQAVNDELASHRRGNEVQVCNKAATAIVRRDAVTPGEPGGNQSHQASEPRNASSNGNPRAATTSQVRALHAIATRQGFNLTERLRERFNLFRAEDLSISQASRLIDDFNGSHMGTNAGGAKA